MHYDKQFVYSLEKCYALSTLNSDGQLRLLVAAEKHAPCYLFDTKGDLIDTVWQEPGGIMTMVPIPGRSGVFLATQRFYSPNDSAEARLVCAEQKPGGWRVTTIAELPFVHRFDVISVGDIHYVLACTLKSGHEYKNDWRSPGKLWVGVLEGNPTAPLELHILKEGLGHNHGYTRYEENGVVSGIVSCDEGVFRVTPPADPEQGWKIEHLTHKSASDAVLLDLDGDGCPELLTLSPFHGDTVAIWHLEGGKYICVYEYPEKLPFLHAIYSGTVHGRPTIYVGNREGKRLLLGFWYDRETGNYCYDEVDRGAGPANCMLFERDGHPALLAANRETNEIAIYDIFAD